MMDFNAEKLRTISKYSNLNDDILSDILSEALMSAKHGCYACQYWIHEPLSKLEFIEELKSDLTIRGFKVYVINRKSAYGGKTLIRIEW